MEGASLTPDERAVGALAEALDAVPHIVTSGWGYTPDEHLAECRKLAPDIWNAIDRDALRAALLADVRREVEALVDPYIQTAPPYQDSAAVEALALSVGWETARAAVLALLGDLDAD